MEMTTKKATATKPIDHSVIMASLPAQEQSVFRIMMTGDTPLTEPEIRTKLGIPNVRVSTRLRDLELRGVIGKSVRRRCSVALRMCNTWKILESSHVPKQKKKRKPDGVPVPSAHELKMYVRDMTVLTAVACSKGARQTPAVKKVHNWLAAGAPTSESDNNSK